MATLAAIGQIRTNLQASEEVAAQLPTEPHCTFKEIIQITLTLFLTGVVCFEVYYFATS